MLKSGEGGCPPAFIIDCLLQSHLEIFDWPRESDTRRVGFFGNELDLLTQGAKVSFSMWSYGQKGLEADRVWGR